MSTERRRRSRLYPRPSSGRRSRRYGANPDLEASEALRDLLLPTLRKDFALMEGYEPSTALDARNERDGSRDVADTNALSANAATRDAAALADDGFSSSRIERAERRVENAARLPVPLVAFGARGDPRYDPAQLSAWRNVAALDRQLSLTDRGDRSPFATDHSRPPTRERLVFAERWFQDAARAAPAGTKDRLLTNSCRS